MLELSWFWRHQRWPFSWNIFYLLWSMPLSKNSPQSKFARMKSQRIELACCRIPLDFWSVHEKYSCCNQLCRRWRFHHYYSLRTSLGYQMRSSLLLLTSLVLSFALDFFLEWEDDWVWTTFFVPLFLDCERGSDEKIITLIQIFIEHNSLYCTIAGFMWNKYTKEAKIEHSYFCPSWTTSHICLDLTTVISQRVFCMPFWTALKNNRKVVVKPPLLLYYKYIVCMYCKCRRDQQIILFRASGTKTKNLRQTGQKAHHQYFGSLWFSLQHENCLFLHTRVHHTLAHRTSHADVSVQVLTGCFIPGHILPFHILYHWAKEKFARKLVL